jgi:hypothetical protein
MMNLTCTHLDSAEPGEDWSWRYVDQVAFVIEPRDAA